MLSTILFAYIGYSINAGAFYWLIWTLYLIATALNIDTKMRYSTKH